MTEQVTLGLLHDEENNVIAHTLELPWRENEPDASCIPAGRYPAHRYLSPKRGYEVFMLDGVPDRSAIELHIGNTVSDTDGCILLGDSFGQIDDQLAVLNSRDGFASFMSLLAGEQNFMLTVIDPNMEPQ